jgi:undecaprenyl-diphosphatase
MSILHAIILGITQGFTEFFPISSSGHLALIPWLFGWNDFAGNETLAKGFDVALHLGTLVGAVAYFRKDLWRYLKGGLAAVFKRDEPITQDGRIAWLLVVSSIPAAVIGAGLNSAIEGLDDQFWLIGVMLIVFGFVLLWADRLDGDRTLASYNLRDALVMGFAQALALQPGVSRSGVTITVGRWLRLDRDTAARISFLMSLPVIAGAGLFQFAKVQTDGGIPDSFLAPFFWGMVAAGISGFGAVWFTLRLVRTHTFTPFVVYRVVVGTGVLVLAASTVR